VVPEWARLKSIEPHSRSSWRICSLSVDWVMLSPSAAAVKEPRFAISTK